MSDFLIDVIGELRQGESILDQVYSARGPPVTQSPKNLQNGPALRLGTRDFSDLPWYAARGTRWAIHALGGCVAETPSLPLWYLDRLRGCIHRGRRCRLGIAAQLTLWALGAMVLIAALLIVVEVSAAADASQHATLPAPLLDEAENLDTDELDASDALSWTTDGAPIATARRIPPRGSVCDEQERTGPNDRKRIRLLAAPKTSPPHSLA